MNKQRFVWLAALLSSGPTFVLGQSHGFSRNYGEAVQMFSRTNLEPTGTFGLAADLSGGSEGLYLAVTEDGKTAYLAGSSLGLAPGPIGEVAVGSASALPVYLPYPTGEGGGPMALSRDQTRLFSGDIYNADVSVLDRSSGDVTVLFNSTIDFYAVALEASPDGTEIYELLAPISNCCMNVTPPQRLNVLNAATGAVKFSIPTFGVNLAVPKTGTLVYSSDGTTTDVIDTAKGSIVGNLPVGGLALAVSPDGTKLFPAQQNIVVADTSSGNLLETITLPNTVSIRVLAVNGQSLYAGGPTLNGLGELAEITLSNYTVARTRTLAGPPFGLALSGDGETILTGLGQNTYIEVIDPALQMVSHVIPAPGSPTPVVSADGKSLYLERPNGVVLIYDTATLAVTGSVVPKTSAAGTLLGVTPDGTELILYSSAIHAVIELNARRGTVTPLLYSYAGQAAFSPDSQYLYLSCSVCFKSDIDAVGLIKYDLAANEITNFVYLPSALFIALSPDGTTLYTSTGLGSQYELVALNTAQMAVTAKINVNIESFALSRDGATIWGLSPPSGNAAILYEISTSTRQVISQFSVGQDFGVALTADNSQIYMSQYLGFDIFDVSTHSLTSLNTYDEAELPVFAH